MWKFTTYVGWTDAKWWPEELIKLTTQEWEKGGPTGSKRFDCHCKCVKSWVGTNNLFFCKDSLFRNLKCTTKRGIWHGGSVVHVTHYDPWSHFQYYKLCHIIWLSYREDNPYPSPGDGLSISELEPWKLSAVVRINILTPTYKIIIYHVMFTKNTQVDKVKGLEIGRRPIFQTSLRCKKRERGQVMIKKSLVVGSFFGEYHALCARESLLSLIF